MKFTGGVASIRRRKILGMGRPPGSRQSCLRVAVPAGAAVCCIYNPRGSVGRNRNRLGSRNGRTARSASCPGILCSAGSLECVPPLTARARWRLKNAKLGASASPAIGSHSRTANAGVLMWLVVLLRSFRAKNRSAEPNTAAGPNGWRYRRTDELMGRGFRDGAPVSRLPVSVGETASR